MKKEVKIPSQSTKLPWSHRRNSQRINSCTRQESQSTNKTTESKKVEDRLLQKNSMTRGANNQSISLGVMREKALMSDRSCCRSSTLHGTIRLSLLSTFPNILLLANGVDIESLTQCKKDVDEHMVLEDGGHRSNQHWLMTTMPKAKFQLIEKDWAKDKTLPTKYLERFKTWINLSKMSPNSTVYTNWKSPYCTVRNDWSGMTIFYIPQAPWLVWNVLELLP